MLKPVPADELRGAKNYVALGFPAEFETTGDIAASSASCSSTACRTTTPRRSSADVQQVTAADVGAVATKYIDAGRFAVVVVGDRSKSKPPLRARIWGRPRL